MKMYNGIVNISVMIVLLFITWSCKQSEHSYEIQNDVYEINLALPLKLADGIIFEHATYNDTTVTFDILIDENIASFEYFIEDKKGILDNMLLRVTAFDSTMRKKMDNYIKYDVGIRYKFYTNKSNRSVIYSLNANQIKEAMSHHNSSKDIFLMWLNSCKKHLPMKIDDGLILTDIFIKDNMVVMECTINDTIYNFEDLLLNKENTKDTIIKKNFDDESGGYQIKRFSEYNMGLIFRYIEKTSKKVIDIEIPAIECKELYEAIQNRTYYFNNN